MQKVYNYCVDRYLSEVEGPLTSEMLVQKTCVLLASMGVGKSTLIEQYIVPKAKELGKWVIFVIPSVAQLDQIALRGVETVCKGMTCTGTQMYYATTPDSLYKVMNCAREREKAVWLVVDEAHAVVTSSAFRKSFLDIDTYAKECEKVIRMTATIDPLADWDLGAVFKVQRRYSPVIPTSIHLVKKLTVDTLYNVARNKYSENETLYMHYNNISDNNLIAEKFSGMISNTSKKVLSVSSNLIEEDLFDHDDFFEEEVIVKDYSVSLSAKNRDNKVTQQLIAGEDITDVDALFMTSFVKEGMNIKNSKKCRVIIVWDKTMTYAEVIQTIGRYRIQENILEIIVVLKAYDKQDVNFVPYEKKLENLRELYSSSINSLNKIATVDKGLAKNWSRTICCILNEETGKYELNECLLRNRAYQMYSDELRKSADLVKKQMEHEFAINLKVSIVSNVFDTTDKDLKDKSKEEKELRKTQFEDVVNEMLNLDIKTLKDVLEHTVDLRYPELQRARELTELYHDLVPSSFKTSVKRLNEYWNVDIVKAFWEISRTSKDEYECRIQQFAAKVINSTIKTHGINDLLTELKGFKSQKDTEIGSRVVFIRSLLKEQEAKQGRITESLQEEIALKLIDAGYYGLKSSNKSINTETDQEKKKKKIEKLQKNNLAKARDKLTQDLAYIYNLNEDRDGRLRISSIKYK